MERQQFEVNKTNIGKTRVATAPITPIDDGEILVAIDRFALTANNVTYGVVGDRIGYWQFFPVDAEYGVIPVWGFGNVVESRHDEIAVGERLYGYWPMGTHLKIQPGKISGTRLFDATEHRRELPPVYNAYARCHHEPHYNPEHDDARMLLFPLYATSYCLYDYLIANDFFGAEQVIVPSASSKTSVGLAYGLANDDGGRKLIGITSTGNLSKTQNMGFYDELLTYDNLGALDSSKPTVIVDMSGNGKMMAELHQALGDNMRFTSHVGLTHYQDNQMGEGYIRDRSEMFFAPGHMQQRNREWGPQVFETKAFQFWLDATAATSSWLKYRHLEGMALTEAAYREVLSGAAQPDVGLILSPAG